MLRTEGAYTLNLRLDSSVGRVWTLNMRLDSSVGRVWTLNLRLDSSIGRIAYKNEHPDFAGCPFAMRQADGLCCGRRGLDAEPAIRLSDQKDSIQKRAH